MEQRLAYEFIKYSSIEKACKLSTSNKDRLMTKNEVSLKIWLLIHLSQLEYWKKHKPLICFLRYMYCMTKTAFLTDRDKTDTFIFWFLECLLNRMIQCKWIIRVTCLCNRMPSLRMIISFLIKAFKGLYRPYRSFRIA